MGRGTVLAGEESCFPASNLPALQIFKSSTWGTSGFVGSEVHAVLRCPLKKKMRNFGIQVNIPLE